MSDLRIREIEMPVHMYSIKCPYWMTPDRVVVHNTANDASAENEIKYMQSNYNQVSYHYAVDDKEAVLGSPLNRNTWHAGDGAYGNGNRKGIAIEICYSKSGGAKFIQAEKNAAKLVAQILDENGWGIDRVFKHQDFSGKYCPHRTLDMGWERFLNMVKALIKVSPVIKPVEVPESSDETFEPYIVRITTAVLNYRTGAGTKYPIAGQVKLNERYTIVDEENGWGKLKSGAGWINLKYTKKV